MKNILATLLPVFLFLSCSDSGALKKYINSKWPPVSVEDQRHEAVGSAANALNKLVAPNMTFGVEIAAVQNILNSSDFKEQGVNNITLVGDKQLLKVIIDFNKTFSDDDKIEGDKRSNLIKELTPQIKGTLTAYAGISSNTLINEYQDTFLNLKLLPAFNSLKVDSIDIKDGFDISLVGELIASLLNRFAENITGEISSLPIMNVKIPAVFLENEDPSGPIKVEGTSEVQVDLRLESSPISSPIKLYGIVWMIDDTHVSVMAKFIPNGTTVPSTTENDVESQYNVLKKRFFEYVNAAFDLPQMPGTTWVGMNKDLLSYAINDSFKQASLCIAGTLKINKQKFQEKVSFPDETTVDCTPTRDCTPRRSCDFKKSHDTRSCNRCLVKKPWGGCLIRGNDPICEAAKAAQNAAYDADYAAKKLDCERLKSQEKLQCEAEKSGEKALCEAGKELLKRLARTGKFANISGSYHGNANLNICIKNFYLSENMDMINITTTASGSATVDVSMKFVPLDIIGHLTCQVPWAEDQKFNATVPKSSVPISTNISFEPLGDDAIYKFMLKEVSIPVRLDPGPTEFLLTSTNMNLACRGADLLKPLLFSATPFIPELQGNFEFISKSQEISTQVKLPAQYVGGALVKGSLRETAKTVLLVGNIS